MAELISPSRLPPSAGPVYRHSSLGAAVFTLVMLLMSLLPIGYRELEDIFPEGAEWPRWLVYSFSGMWGLMALMGLGYWRRGMSPDNWRVRLRPDGMWIHLRSHINSGFPPEDRVVLDLPFGEIHWFRKTRERASSPGSEAGTEQIRFSTYLDLKVSPETAARVRETLQAEQARMEEFRRKQWIARHFPVAVQDGDLVRVTWSGLRPGFRHLRQQLAGKLTEEPELYIRQSDWAGLSGPELEARIADLARKGREIEALSLIRQKYGHSLAEARRVLANLKNS